MSESITMSTRFPVVQKQQATLTGHDVDLVVSGEGFAIIYLGAEVAYCLSENSLVEWALYTAGARAVHHKYDLRAVEDREDGRR